MVDSKQDRLAKEVVELSISFKMALSNKRKYPMAEFKSVVAAAKRYIEALGKDPLIHRDVVSAISGLREFLELERKRVPGEVLCDADRLECLFFAGYDPHFEGDEPPGLSLEINPSEATSTISRPYVQLAFIAGSCRFCCEEKFGCRV